MPEPCVPKNPEAEEILGSPPRPPHSIRVVQGWAESIEIVFAPLHSLILDVVMSLGVCPLHHR